MNDKPFMPVVDDKYAFQALRDLTRSQADEIERLRAENERLRELAHTLAKIADDGEEYTRCAYDPSLGSIGDRFEDMAKRARAALSGSGEE